jgi:protein-S-isoprenylcysteine O-methyltransferase Ste14
MGRSIALLYGILSYIFFFAAFLYFIGFVGNLLVPKSIDSGEAGAIGAALIINFALISVFALQHSVMARPAFKRAWTRIIPAAIERSTYVLTSTLALILLMALWQPMPGMVWSLSGTAALVMYAIFAAGWVILLTSTFMIDHFDHFDLFGLRQVYLGFKQRELTRGKFHKRLFYKLVRHPIMTGFLIAFWATPVMTIGHLFFALGMTVYIYVAVKMFEEKDLIAEIGQPYIDYQSEVGPFFPGIGKSKTPPATMHPAE